MTRRSAGAVQQLLDLLALQSAAVRRAWLALITQLPPPPGIPRGQRSCATICALPRKLRQFYVYVGTTTK